jgi:hypothetical protein
LLAYGPAHEPSYWGGCHWPDEVLARTRMQRFGGKLRFARNLALAAALGIVLGNAADRIAGGDVPAVWIGVGALLTAIVPFVVDAIIPDVEIALLGKTRLRVYLRKTASSVGATVGAQVLAFLLGK